MYCTAILYGWTTFSKVLNTHENISAWKNRSKNGIFIITQTITFRFHCVYSCPMLSYSKINFSSVLFSKRILLPGLWWAANSIPLGIGHSSFMYPTLWNFILSLNILCTMDLWYFNILNKTRKQKRKSLDLQYISSCLCNLNKQREKRNSSEIGELSPIPVLLGEHNMVMRKQESGLEGLKFSLYVSTLLSFILPWCRL